MLVHLVPVQCRISGPGALPAVDERMDPVQDLVVAGSDPVGRQFVLRGRQH